MRILKYSVLILIVLLSAGCITEFVPEIEEETDMLVVEGMITDQIEPYTIVLSRSLPLAQKKTPVRTPVRGCTVIVSDDKGNNFPFIETSPGTYKSYSENFRGIPGRKYKLFIRTNNPSSENYTYESPMVEMKPVPPIDTLFYEKVVIKEGAGNLPPAEEGCQVYLETHDPQNLCKYYRWTYNETWEFNLPYTVTNWQCWLSNNSNTINIKNTSVLAENRISRYPVKFISNETDRLKVKYSMLVNQYSLNESEYAFWEKLQNISQDVGSLYDITPASIAGNVYCVEDPSIPVLGYFSVSAVSSKRIFIKEFFSGIVNLYSECPVDTIYGNRPIPNLDYSVWII
ncbi:MAG: DUF4249 domain-containing protein, partial [Bacteroidales bacterium]|nr:DUF4249 domain-containing protein [Bacteroidales bacterium]